MKEQIKDLSGNERNLAGEFCIVDGEFSDLQFLMNTLQFLFINEQRVTRKCY